MTKEQIDLRKAELRLNVETMLGMEERAKTAVDVNLDDLNRLRLLRQEAEDELKGLEQITPLKKIHE